MARSLDQDAAQNLQFSSAETENLLRLIDQQLRDSSLDSAAAETGVFVPEPLLAPSVLPAVRSLYMALACRDRATAEHSRRVAERIYGFAHATGLDVQECLALELAGLLHDVGKIGVPDTILFKNGKLTPEERALIGRHRRMGIEAIRPLIGMPRVIETLSQANAWYDGSHDQLAHAGSRIGTGARMLAIIDAFDAMTSDRAYRKALPPDVALEELSRLAGQQFDPALVAQFQEFAAALPESRPTGFWTADFGTMVAGPLENTTRSHARPIDFYSRVVSDLKDGICFVRPDGHVFFWSKAAEQLTGYRAEEMCQRHWNSLEEFRSALFGAEPISQSLFLDAISQGSQRSERMTLTHKFGHPLQVELQVVPVLGDAGSVSGLAIIFHDIRRSIELESRFDELAARATRDPLTGVYNRAEFDRRLPLFLKEHSERSGTCSLVIADLDYFKEVNDTFGHACGDDVLRRFGQILAADMGGGGIVARYGGEEFVVLLPTPLEIAVRRCEGVRAVISKEEFPDLRGRRITSSFGVSSFDLGDTPDTLFARADQALFMAKQQGRNRTVAIDPIDHVPRPPQQPGPQHEGSLFEAILSVSGPQETVRQKLTGFIDEHSARVLQDTDNTMTLQVGTAGLLRWVSRRADRMPVRITLSFRPPRRQRIEVHVCITPAGALGATHGLGPATPAAQARCRSLLASLKTYLIAD